MHPSHWPYFCCLAIYLHRYDAYIFGRARSTQRTPTHRLTITTTTRRVTLWGRIIRWKSSTHHSRRSRHTDTGLHYKMVAIVDLRVTVYIFGPAMCSYDLADDVCRPCVCNIGRHATVFFFIVFVFVFSFEYIFHREFH